MDSAILGKRLYTDVDAFRKVWRGMASTWMKYLRRSIVDSSIRLRATQELIGMNLKRAPRRHAARLELLDALMDSYLHWRDESRAVAESYRNWRATPLPGREVAFDEYLAALDREEHAACGYRRAVEQTQGT